MTRVHVDVPSMTFRLPPGVTVSVDTFDAAFRVRLEEILAEHASELVAPVEGPGPAVDRSALESAVTRAVGEALTEAAT